MAHRIEIFTKIKDTRSSIMSQKLANFKVEQAKVADVYTINKKFKERELQRVAQMLANPITQNYLIDDYTKDLAFDFVIEIGFLPGVTDNVAHSAKESIEDLFKIKFTPEESVHTSTLIFLKGQITLETAQEIANNLANPLIQRISIKDHEKFAEEKGMDIVVPKVHLQSQTKLADKVNLDIPEEELLKLGKEGILSEDGSRRGPLALDKEYLLTIKNYFKKEGRDPTDIELESLAQTWSEHCKHTIFAAEIDELKDGLYKGYIKKATQEIRQKKGDKDFCVSVFSDNAGGILFDENWVICDKAETHNSPSALDPFGGAVTGIVGVNRDVLGFGLGAKPIINKYGFCVGLPDDEEPIYRDSELKNQALPPKRIFQGLVDGVNAGGNQSGIPTPQGFLYFHKDFKGKPLVFVGTVGLIPKEIKGKPSWEKGAKKGDKIVVIGGRVGQDGIHGATFSSEAISAGSPATAVQIGDPITQKKLSDALVKEIRDLNLYNSITDCGAGGISCSVAEMARQMRLPAGRQGGCEVEFDKVPLKYPNLEPWKIWISESQERMTLAVPPEKVEKFTELMEKHGVEVSVIGDFTDSGRCVVKFQEEKIMDLEMDFLHEGLPKKTLKTTLHVAKNPEPDFPQPKDLTKTLLEMISRPNLCSYEFISTQYDHNVQGTAVIGPLQGKGRVNGNTSVTMPFAESTKGIICSQGINPNYSLIDTYHMAACAMDTAIRNVIAAGGTLEHLALMDNFCWCSSDEPERLGQLKQAAKACYDYAIKYGAPFISGKDSMFNDFKGFDSQGNSIKISAPPTLLISSLGVLDDITKAVSLDPKFPGDLIYILGQPKIEMGGSEYFAYHNCIGNDVPKVNASNAINLYKKFTEATEKRLISSALSPSIGGIGIALAKKALAGQFGMEIDLCKLPDRADYVLFSESQSLIIVTIDPKKQSQFEEHFKDISYALLGSVTNDRNFIVKGNDGSKTSELIRTNLDELDKSYRKLFKDC